MSRKPKASWKKKLLIVLNCILASILFVLAAGTVWVEFILDDFSYKPEEKPALSAEELDALQNDMQGSTVDPTDDVVGRDEIELENQDLIITGENVFNFLLVGQDRRPGEARARSDSMILVTVNTKAKTITLTSLMRDMYVQIPGYMDNRINVAYSIDGIDLLYKTIEHNFGLQLDRFVEVDFSGFAEIVDIVGGVDVELTEAEASHLNYNEDYYGFPNESWQLVPGVNHLTGNQALAYARVRRVDGTGDFSRTERQRKVMTAMIEKASDMSWSQIYSLITSLSDVVTTDMSSNDILAYAYTFYSMIDEMTIQTQRLPVDGSYTNRSVEGVGQVLIPDLAKNREVLALTQQ